MRVIAILPARNEAPRIADVIAGIKRTRAVGKIIVVDDASTDGTAEAAKRAGAQVIRFAKRGGVGAATRAGLREALRHSPDGIVFLDADGQHNPRYIPAFLKKMTESCDFVIGKRDLSRYPLRKRFGNFMLRLLAELVAPTGIEDPECGFRAMTPDAARRMDLRAQGYSICMDFVYNVWKNRFRVGCVKIEVPLYHPKKGTKIVTGFANFWWLLKRRAFG
ncbi:MAG: glycosyltransferase family 2 protein [Candidatus Aenigmatarchaeota archaeon]